MSGTGNVTKLVGELTGVQLCHILRTSMRDEDSYGNRKVLAKKEVELERMRIDKNKSYSDARVAVRERHSMAIELANLQMSMATLKMEHSELTWKLNELTGGGI